MCSRFYIMCWLVSCALTVGVCQTKRDVRSPVGIRICVHLCSTVSRCHSPVYIPEDLICYLSNDYKGSGKTVYHPKFAKAPNYRKGIHCSHSRYILTRTKELKCIYDFQKEKKAAYLIVTNWSQWFRYSLQNRSWEEITSLQAPKDILIQKSEKVYLITQGNNNCYILEVAFVFDLKSRTEIFSTQSNEGRLCNLAGDEDVGIIFFTDVYRLEKRVRLYKLTVADKKVSFLKSYKAANLKFLTTDTNRKLMYGYRTRCLVEMDYGGDIQRELILSSSFLLHLTYDKLDKVLLLLFESYPSSTLYSVSTSTATLEAPRKMIEFKPPKVLILLQEDFSDIVVLGDGGHIYDRDFALQGNMTSCPASTYPSNGGMYSLIHDKQ